MCRPSPSGFSPGLFTVVRLTLAIGGNGGVGGCPGMGGTTRGSHCRQARVAANADTAAASHITTCDTTAGICNEGCT